MFTVKAQVILITVFALLGGIVVLFITLMPLTYQLVSLKETTDSYQAIANAEAGLELVFLKDIKQSDQSDPYNIRNCTKCTVGNCTFSYQEKTSATGDIIKILSTGKKGRFERTLIFETRE